MYNYNCYFQEAYNFKIIIILRTRIPIKLLYITYIHIPTSIHKNIKRNHRCRERRTYGSYSFEVILFRVKNKLI